MYKKVMGIVALSTQLAPYTIYTLAIELASVFEERSTSPFTFAHRSFTQITDCSFL